MKEQVLHRMRAEFESSGLVVSCKELPTKMLPMVFLRLNKISGGCEKIVSESFWNNLFKIFRNDGFKCVVVRVKCKSERNAIGIFLLWQLYGGLSINLLSAVVARLDIHSRYFDLMHIGMGTNRPAVRVRTDSKRVRIDWNLMQNDWVRNDWKPPGYFLAIG